MSANKVSGEERLSYWLVISPTIGIRLFTFTAPVDRTVGNTDETMVESSEDAAILYTDGLIISETIKLCKPMACEPLGTSVVTSTTFNNGRSVFTLTFIPL